MSSSAAVRAGFPIIGLTLALAGSALAVSEKPEGTGSGPVTLEDVRRATCFAHQRMLELVFARYHQEGGESLPLERRSVRLLQEKGRMMEDPTEPGEPESFPYEYKEGSRERVTCRQHGLAPRPEAARHDEASAGPGAGQYAGLYRDACFLQQRYLMDRLMPLAQKSGKDVSIDMASMTQMVRLGVLTELPADPGTTSAFTYSARHNGIGRRADIQCSVHGSIAGPKKPDER